jgi:hypothetical protein
MKEKLLNQLSMDKVKRNFEEKKDDINTNDKVINRIDKRQENAIEIDNKSKNYVNQNINDENFFNFSLYHDKNNSNNEKLEKFDYINNNNNVNKGHNEVLKEKGNQLEHKLISNLENPLYGGLPKSKNHTNISKNNCNNLNHKKNTLKIKLGDWFCFFCQNLNFSFRTNCNRCGISKELSEYKKMQIQIMNQQKQNQLHLLNRNFYNPYINSPNINNNNNYNNSFFNSNYPAGINNIIYCPVIFNNYYYIGNFRNYNNYKIFNPCNVNIK